MWLKKRRIPRVREFMKNLCKQLRKNAMEALSKVLTFSEINTTIDVHEK